MSPSAVRGLVSLMLTVVLAAGCGADEPEIPVAPLGTIGWDLVGNGELVTVGTWDVIAPAGWTRTELDGGGVSGAAFSADDGRELRFAFASGSAILAMVGELPDGIENVRLGTERPVPGYDPYARFDRSWRGRADDRAVAVASARFDATDTSVLVTLTLPGDASPSADLEDALTFVSYYAAQSAA